MGRDKESHFFDRETGVDWRTPDYDILHQAYADDEGRLRGDATPVTLFWTPAQYRMLAYNPQMRFIILLRDPAERAYSHWKMIRGRGQEPLPFGEAIREGRVRIMLHDAGERPVRLRTLAAQVEEAIAALSGAIDGGWRVVALRLVRSRIVKSGGGDRWTATGEFAVKLYRER
jgi:hypothetical protein